MLSSYPSIFALGHRYLTELLLDSVLVEEKIDGSQFSFGVTGAGELHCRSKGAVIEVEAPEKMFNQGVLWVRENASKLEPGWTYRAEYLQKPNHNVLAYERIPANHLILFDIMRGPEDYVPAEFKREEGARLGLEVVPAFYEGRIETADFLRSLLEKESVLGGCKIEGVVVKNYQRFGLDKKPLLGKFVSEAFKEKHQREWKAGGNKDVIQVLIGVYRSEARWSKAVQHLREAGLLEDSPKDIGSLFREVPADIRKEEEEEIKQKLFDWAWPQIQRGCTAGMAEWYKSCLLEKQFDENHSEAASSLPTAGS